MRRVYFGSWVSASDMHADLRGAREHYEHADNPQMHFGYPLTGRERAQVVFASSPDVHAARRPVIFLIRGGMFALQYRTDRWAPVLKWCEDVWAQRFRFTCSEAAAGFAQFQKDALHLECSYSQFIESRCECGAYVAGMPGACQECLQASQRETETYHAATLGRWRSGRERAAAKRAARKAWALG